jgi:hypothetical protein
MKKILIIAFHYPPFSGSSGVQRALKFSQYLPRFGWQPVVLTAHPLAYPKRSDDQLAEIPERVEVRRAFALDAARHMALAGRYPGWVALPDRWISWVIGGTLTGLSMIRRHEPRLLWSTYPIATAHLLARILHRRSGVPWIADFRDSMTEEGFPADPAAYRAYRRIERSTVRHCRRAVFTAPGTRAMYADRYPDLPASRWAVVRNGYDEENFAQAEASRPSQGSGNGPLTLLHSGVLYRSERDPRCFFDALARLRDSGEISAERLQVVLRASGDEDYHRAQLRQRGIDGIVRLEPPLPYREALTEMLNADGLLLFQAANCNHQIPAKVYEYLRARRPILALTDAAGDTASFLREVGVGTAAPIDSEAGIAQALKEFLALAGSRQPTSISREECERHTRESRARELARILDDVDQQSSEV